MHVTKFGKVSLYNGNTCIEVTSCGGNSMKIRFSSPYHNIDVRRDNTDTFVFVGEEEDKPIYWSHLGPYFT